MIENPTEEQLRTLKGVVYMIKNKLNDKCYIGKAINGFVDRYGSMKWWKCRNLNRMLKNSIGKHGHEISQVFIIEHSIFDDNELLKRESGYITSLNTLAPNGYNFIQEEWGGRAFSEEMKDHLGILASKGKTYKIKEMETGEIKEFKSQREIRIKYGIAEQNLNLLLKGKRRSIKGICLPETNPDKFFGKQTETILLDQNNKKYRFYSLTDFSEKYELGYGPLLRVKYGETLVAKTKSGIHFRLPTTSLEDAKYRHRAAEINPNQKYAKIILTKNDTDYEILPNEITEFCLKNNIKKWDIYALINKAQKTAKKFKLKEVTYFKTEQN